MKIVIDLQGAQSESRHRGIGRYAKSMALALTEAAQGRHEIWLVLNERLDRSEDSLRLAFSHWLPPERIVDYTLPGPMAAIEPGNDWRRYAAELLRENFLRGMGADWVWNASLFEGWLDDSATSSGRLTGSAAQSTTLYDLIPLTRPEEYLVDKHMRAWYMRKVDDLRKQDHWFAISEWTKKEAMECLDLPAQRVTVAPCGVEDAFTQLNGADVESVRARLRLVHGIDRDFVFYMGGFDARKNVSSLIAAFARTKAAICHSHLLVIGGRISNGERVLLQEVMRKHDLSATDVIFTGQIDDVELVGLYNACALFVFPSLHEGFGLTVLEAMACGAPVLAANRTSLPEVVGQDAMLFDPANIDDLAGQMVQVLDDASLRRAWSEYGKQRAKGFTWQRGARRMLEAFEAGRAKQAVGGREHKSRLRLAYVSPLPPEASGIADYSAELLPELAKYYAINVVVPPAQAAVVQLKTRVPVRTTTWFAQNAHRFDRILYQFGNSPFHLHMFDLLWRYPGTVVLHDSCLGALSHWRSLHAGTEPDYARRLYGGHGYRALLDDQQRGRDYTIGAYSSNTEVFESAIGVLVHSDYAIANARRFHGDHAASWMRRIPFPKAPHRANRKAARKHLYLPDDAFVVCSFGMLAPTKLNHCLLEAWLSSTLARRADCRLVFVGENHGGDYGQALVRRIEQAQARSLISITGFAEDNAYQAWLAAADVAVQLRTESRGETSAAVFDCMAHALPLIVNAHATFAELPDDALVKLPDHFEERALADALERLAGSPTLRQALAERALHEVTEHHALPKVAQAYRDAIETFATTHPLALEQDTIRTLGVAGGVVTQEKDLWLTAQALVHNRQPMRLPRLFLDVTVVAGNDLKTGIERVTRNLARELLQAPPDGWRVELVKLVDGRYVHAHDLALRLLGLKSVDLDEEAAELGRGDVFLGLDWVADRVPAHQALYQSWRHRGIAVYFLVYDLLPVLQPAFFPKDTEAMHARWLESIATCADGLVCISRTVAEELCTWIDHRQVPRKLPLRLGFSHIGADLDGKPAEPEKLTDTDKTALEAITQRPTVLMVGTLEPRKGHGQALAAFEALWAHGASLNLVIVGKQGWMMEAFCQRLLSHPEAGKHLFWCQGISDTMLRGLYRAATVLLSASEGEGYGLPLIEAAQYGVPIIARDLPVFREVAGAHATYFQSNDASGLADTIERWFAEHAASRAPSSVGMPWLSWQQSAAQLARMLLVSDAPGWLAPWCATYEPGVAVGAQGLQLVPAAGSIATKVEFTGWGESEPWGRWALGQRSRLHLRLSGQCDGRQLCLALQAKAFVDARHSLQRFQIYANGHLLDTWDCSHARPEVSRQWPVSSTWLGEHGELEITLLQADAISPAALGLSRDTRLLGLGVRQMSLAWLDHDSATETATMVTSPDL